MESKFISLQNSGMDTGNQIYLVPYEKEEFETPLLTTVGTVPHSEYVSRKKELSEKVYFPDSSFKIPVKLF